MEAEQLKGHLEGLVQFADELSPGLVPGSLLQRGVVGTPVA
jgi:hypothetical protein